MARPPPSWRLLHRLAAALAPGRPDIHMGPAMPKYLHTMIPGSHVDQTVAFFTLLGLKEVKRMENDKGRYTLVFLAAPGDEEAQVELTYNWPPEEGEAEHYGGGRNFGHLAYRVENIYDTCQRLMD